MNNLEMIRKAYAMNYAAQLEYEGHVLQVLFVRGKDLVLRFIGGLYDGQLTVESEEIFENDFEITSFVYMGQLGGNEEPEDEQKFRVRPSGEILLWQPNEGYKTAQNYPKEDIEPYFD